MQKIWLFDWGNTLMVDDPQQSGKMRDWPDVVAIEGAEALLASLSGRGLICIASGAKDSDAGDIIAALGRVGLARYVDHCFCPATLGFAKGEPEFLPQVLTRLSATPGRVTMIGDSWARDIEPALAMDMKAVWLNPQQHPVPDHVGKLTVISTLSELL